MIFEQFFENLSISIDNYSILYILCALVSFLAVWYTWNNEPRDSNIETKEESRGDSLSNEDESDHSNVSSLLEKKKLIKSIEQSLTRDDRSKENEIEKQQLKDILDVMKKDDKFPSTTMEELEEQLKLYRE